MGTIDNFVERDQWVKLAFLEDNPDFVSDVIGALSERHAGVMPEIKPDQLGNVYVAQMISNEIVRQTNGKWKVANPYNICTFFSEDTETPFLNTDDVFVVPQSGLRDRFGRNFSEQNIRSIVGGGKSPFLAHGLDAEPRKKGPYIFASSRETSYTRFRRRDSDQGIVFEPYIQGSLWEIYAFRYAPSGSIFSGKPLKKIVWNASAKSFYLLDDLNGKRFPSGESRTPLISISAA
jgi:hypothetical protein